MTDTTTGELIETMRTTLSTLKADTHLLSTIALNCERHCEDLERDLAALRALRPEDDFSSLDELLRVLAQLGEICTALDMDDAGQDLDVLQQTLEDEDETDDA